jgi:hypothetical protein
MPSLTTYPNYGGRFPTTAAITNALACQGVTAPHTGEPYTEAMLTGLSGGIALGYFTFAYEGFDPQVNILTRNTFNDYGWDRVTERLGLVQDVTNATKSESAEAKLVTALEEGRAPVVWADVMTLGYEGSELGEEMWMMQPVVVTSFEPDGEAVIDDRAAAPIKVPGALLGDARGKVKKLRYKLVTLDAPDTPDMRRVVREAIAECVSLYTEKPPRGSANNFGFKAFDRWIGVLRKLQAKGGWLKEFPTPRERLAALSTAFKYSLLYWEGDTQDADRALYADFLGEAAVILESDTLPEAARLFRASADMWGKLGDFLLPDRHKLLSRARSLLSERHTLFLNSGNARTERLHELDLEYQNTLASAGESALADDDAAGDLFAGIADMLEQIRDTEREAVSILAS